jgi:rhodanese-related sulfurtransferase
METEPTIPPRELAARPDTVILDVRGKPDDAQIPGSRYFDSDALLGDPTLPDDIPFDAPIAVYCGSGNTCKSVALALRAHGYESAVAVEGGWRGWREAGLPVEPRKG